MSKEKLFVKGDILGGLVSALVALPLTLACGILLFKDIYGFEQLGINAAVYSAIIASLVSSFIGSHSLQVSGPRVISTIILADFLFSLYAKYSSTLNTVDIQNLLIVFMFLSVLFSGIIQYIFSLLRLGKLIKFLPTSVTMGVSFTVAIIIIFKQFSVIFNTQNNNFNFSSFYTFESLVLFFIAIIIIFLLLFKDSEKTKEFREKIYIKDLFLFLPILIPLFASIAILMIFPSSSYLLLGDLSISSLDIFFPLNEINNLMPLIYENKVELFTTSLVIALMGTLNSILSITALETKQLALNNNTSIELKGQAFGNILSALFHGMPSSGSEARGLSNYNAGGRTKFSLFVHSFCLFIFVFLLNDYLAYIPKIVLSAVLVYTAIIMSLPLYSMAKRMCLSCLQKKDKNIKSCIKDILQTFSVVIVMLISTYVFDIRLAILFGFVWAMLLFIYEMTNNSSHKIVDSRFYYSKKVRTNKEQDFLKNEMKSLNVIELEGAIFFGTADKLRDEIKTINEEIKYIILDFRKVNEVDITGAQIISLCKKDKDTTEFYFSHVRKDDDTYQALCAVGLISETSFNYFENTDLAYEYVENELLNNLNPKINEEKILEIKDFEIFQVLSEINIEILEKYLSIKEYKKGDFLFKTNEESKELFFLRNSFVTIFADYNKKESNLRRISFKAGVVLGEMAFLENKKHSLSAKINNDTSVYILKKEDFNKLLKLHPLLSSTLLLGLCTHLSNRLRNTTKELRLLEEWN